MSTDLWVAIIGGTALVFTALIGLPRIVRDPTTKISKELEIYNALPATSSSKAHLLDLIDGHVAALHVNEVSRRSPFGVTMGALFLIMAAASSWLVWQAAGWWWLTSPFVLALWIIGGVGLAQGLAREPRNETGGLLRYAKTHKDTNSAAGAGSST